MKKLYDISLFIFRRDLRLMDNTALNNAFTQSHKVIPCFIFDPRQITEKNKYKSNNAIQYMLESLKFLSHAIKKQQGKLYFFYGKTEDILKNILTQKLINAVFINRDYTPFSIMRDTTIKQLCSDHAISFNMYNDALLTQPEEIIKKDNTHYSIFSAFYKKAVTYKIEHPVKQQKGTWFVDSIKNAESTTIFTKILTEPNKNLIKVGNRNSLLQQCKKLKNYTKEKDYPIIATSHFSPHLKFGTISIREAFYAIQNHLGQSHPLLRQFYWRDFFTHIAYHVPHVFGHPYHTKYNNLPWNNDKKLFTLWCQGKTGFPIIDAGMRELNTTGFMHNRVRMIVASFLIKDLHINWLWGEQYFAQQLIDYDPAVNNGNWQWCASTGCDSQPYFRIFNPWLQQKKYDPDCLYIKKWIPELKKYDPKIIHTWFKKHALENNKYPHPIVDHIKESIVAKKIYKKTTSG